MLTADPFLKLMNIVVLLIRKAKDRRKTVEVRRIAMFYARGSNCLPSRRRGILIEGGKKKSAIWRTFLGRWTVYLQGREVWRHSDWNVTDLSDGFNRKESLVGNMSRKRRSKLDARRRPENRKQCERPERPASGDRRIELMNRCDAKVFVTLNATWLWEL